MKGKRILPVLLSVAMLAGALAGCNGGDTPAPSSSTGGDTSSTTPTSSTPAESTPAEEPKGDPTEISVAFWDVETALSGGEGDAILKFIEEGANVKLTPVNTTWDDYPKWC